MDALEAIRTRRSIRKYKDRPVEKEKLMQVLDAGRWAPSAGNCQDWEFIVVEDAKKKKEFFEAAMRHPFVLQAPVLIVVCADLERSYERGFHDKEFYAMQDTAIASQNMLLAAHALGLGTCWIGDFREKETKDVLGIPKHVKPVAVIALGYPDMEPTSTRKELEEMVHWNKF